MAEATILSVQEELPARVSRLTEVAFNPCFPHRLRAGIFLIFGLLLPRPPPGPPRGGRGHAGPGDRLVIQGAGGLGLNAIAVARERGVSQVIVIDGIQSRLELALDFGADQVIDLDEYPAAEDRVRRVFELAVGGGGGP